MEDFGFKLQNIKNKNWFKKSIKFWLVIFAILIFTIILIKTIDIISIRSFDTLETVSLIKSQVKEIKIVPEKEGGLVVENLDVSVYNVINNKEKEEINPIVKKIKKDINLPNNNNNIITEQDLLTQKINEISEDKNIYSSPVKKTEEPINVKNSQQNNEIKHSRNIKINNNEKKVTTNVNDLKKLGNNSLISNLKNKKDIKPGIKVQLLALKSKEGLIEYWEELKNKHLNLFNDKNYYIEKVDLSRTGAIYRLQVGNFIDKHKAAEFCKEYIELTNKNKVDCIIVKN